MSKKSRKATKFKLEKYEPTEMFAFIMIVFVIIILFSAIAFIVSAKPVI